MSLFVNSVITGFLAAVADNRRGKPDFILFGRNHFYGHRLEVNGDFNLTASPTAVLERTLAPIKNRAIEANAVNPLDINRIVINLRTNLIIIPTRVRSIDAELEFACSNIYHACVKLAVDSVVSL